MECGWQVLFTGECSMMHTVHLVVILVYTQLFWLVQVGGSCYHIV
jgi:hypothetical protein